MRHLTKLLYAPLFWFGFVGGAAWILSDPTRPAWWLIPLAGCAVILSFLAEAWIPYDRAWNASQGDRQRDVAHALTNESLNLFGLQAWGLASALAGRITPVNPWPSHAPFLLQLLLAIVICDLGITLMHFASHRWPLLWRLHAVHHSVRRMYGFNGLMKHPLHQLVEAAAGFTPLLLLGAPTSVVLGVAFATLIQLLLQHGNVDMRLGPLRHVFAFAPVHRFHHLKYGSAGDVNFGFFFNAWDHLLGTAFDDEKARVRTRDLGIGGRPDYPVHYLNQLREPFRAAVVEQEVPAPPAWLKRP